MTTIDDSTGAALGLISLLLFVALYLWTALALSAVFRKSGEQGWKAWVPILNQIVLLQLGRLSGWLFLLVLIPFAGPLIVWALQIVACYRINVSFGHGVGMTVLAALVLPVWASILGFGPARWLGTELASRGPQGGGPRRASTVDDNAATEYVPRAAPPAYSPSEPLPVAPAGGWTPPPLRPPPPLASPAVSEGKWGGFDLGAVSELTDEVTGADSGAAAPVSAAPMSAAPMVTSPPATSPPVSPPPVTRVRSAPVPKPAAPEPAAPEPAEPWAPRRSSMVENDAFPEGSGQVSAIVGAPGGASASRGSGAEPQGEAATPRSARASVSAQHTKAEIPEDPIDETIITRRRRTAWSLIPPSGAAIPITAEVVLLGRKPAADRAYPEAQLVSIDDGTVSKTHARLVLREDAWWITDLDSTNGVLFATFMGTEVEAAPSVEVEAGERFLLGDAEVRLSRSDA